MRINKTTRLIVAILLPLIIVSAHALAQTSEQTSKLETLQQYARQGNAEAQLYLGVIYAIGQGVPQDYREAVKWYRLAADQGLADAQFSLGVTYHTGKGVPQDYREAVKWYRLAADQGLADAQFSLGVTYHTGKGVPQDYREAVKWYRLAADQGHASAQFILGAMYNTGEGVPQDYREAVQWYQLAADQGHAGAQFNLGLRYANGLGVPQDYREAVQWYRLAADQGHADAQVNLGWMYGNGKGVIQDYREAYIWFSLAAVNGDKDATKNRDIVVKHLSSGERQAATAEAKRRLQAIDAHLTGETGEQKNHANVPPPVPLTPVAPPAPQQSTAQRAFEHGWRSVVVLTTSDTQGSGVIVRPNVVATNCHVVDDGTDIVVYKAENRRARTDTPYPAKIRLTDRERDLCLLDVSNLWGVPAQIREAKSLSIGEAVYAIGAPSGLDYSLSAGVVSQLRTDAGDAPVIQTDAAVSPGSSGGGLFDASGNLVGITTQKISDGEITFAIPAEWILEMR